MYAFMHENKSRKLDKLTWRQNYYLITPYPFIHFHSAAAAAAATAAEAE